MRREEAGRGWSRGNEHPGPTGIYSWPVLKCGWGRAALRWERKLVSSLQPPPSPQRGGWPGQRSCFGHGAGGCESWVGGFSRDHWLKCGALLAVCALVHTLVYAYLLGIVLVRGPGAGGRKAAGPTDKEGRAPERGKTRLWTLAVKGWERPTGWRNRSWALEDEKRPVAGNSLKRGGRAPGIWLSYGGRAHGSPFGTQDHL